MMALLPIGITIAVGLLVVFLVMGAFKTTTAGGGALGTVLNGAGFAPLNTNLQNHQKAAQQGVGTAVDFILDPKGTAGRLSASTDPTDFTKNIAKEADNGLLEFQSLLPSAVAQLRLASTRVKVHVLMFGPDLDFVYVNGKGRVIPDSYIPHIRGMQDFEKWRYDKDGHSSDLNAGLTGIRPAGARLRWGWSCWRRLIPEMPQAYWFFKVLRYKQHYGTDARRASDLGETWHTDSSADQAFINAVEAFTTRVKEVYDVGKTLVLSEKSRKIMDQTTAALYVKWGPRDSKGRLERLTPPSVEDEVLWSAPLNIDVNDPNNPFFRWTIVLGFDPSVDLGTMKRFCSYWIRYGAQLNGKPSTGVIDNKGSRAFQAEFFDPTIAPPKTCDGCAPISVADDFDIDGDWLPGGADFEEDNNNDIRDISGE